MEYHVIVARDIGAISERDASSLIGEVIEVRRMLHGLIMKLTPKGTSVSPV